MRIQFWGDAAGTGFGTVTRGLGKALLDTGHDVRFVSQNDTGGDLEEPFGSRTFQVTPDLVDAEAAAEFGLNSLALSVKGILGLIRGELWQDGWRPNAAIMLGDFASVRRLVMSDEDTIAAFRALPTYHYVPIEGIDLPPAWAGLWQVIAPVAMCQDGATQIEKVVGYRPPVVYHGVDTDLFYPVSKHRPIHIRGANGRTTLRTKADCKRFLGGDPRERWIFRADRFMPRKRYGSWLRAIAPVVAERPDVRAIMHCRSIDEGGYMGDLLSKYPTLHGRMQVSGFHDLYGGAPTELLAVLYNAADVYASNSAEGFGLTIAEAMACGTPVVGLDYAAVPEVVGPGGVLAPVNRLDDNEYGYAWATVDERAFGAAVARLLDDDVARHNLGKRGRAHIVNSFQWHVEARKFAEAMSTRQAVAA